MNGEWCLCVFINQIHIKNLVMVMGMPTDIYSNEMNAPKLKIKESQSHFLWVSNPPTLFDAIKIDVERDVRIMYREPREA